MTSRRRVISKMQWSASRTAGVAIGANADALIDLASLLRADMPSLSNYTLMRSIIRVGMQSDTTAPVELTVGVITIPDSVSVTEMPKSGVHFHADWLWWTGIQAARSDFPMNYLEVDLGGMRRLREAESRPVMNIHNHNGSLAAQFFVWSRLLFGLR